jgi:hypothetical protein
VNSSSDIVALATGLKFFADLTRGIHKLLPNFDLPVKEGFRLPKRCPVLSPFAVKVGELDRKAFANMLNDV